MSGRIVGVVAATLLVLQVSAAVAQDSDPAQTALARQLFEEGNQLGAAGDWSGAADRFRRANTIRPSAAIAFNLARAERELGHLVAAAEAARAALRDQGAPSAVRERCEALLAEIEPRLARLTVRLTGSPEGAETYVDAHRVDPAALGVAMPMDPAPHAVEVRRGDDVVARRELTLAEGASEELELQVPAPPPRVPMPDEVEGPPPPPREPPPVDEGGGGVFSQWWFWTAVGLVIAGGVTVAIVATSSGGVQDPITGDFEPGVVAFP